MLPVDFLPGARRDFDESFDWYAERSTLAAIRFANAVEAALAQAASNSSRFPVVDQLHLQCQVKRFPFRVIYRIVESRVLVVAIAHAKRRPGFWKDRG